MPPITRLQGRLGERRREERNLREPQLRDIDHTKCPGTSAAATARHVIGGLPLVHRHPTRNSRPPNFIIPISGRASSRLDNTNFPYISIPNDVERPTRCYPHSRQSDHSRIRQDCRIQNFDLIQRALTPLLPTTPEATEESTPAPNRGSFRLPFQNWLWPISSSQQNDAQPASKTEIITAVQPLSLESCTSRHCGVVGISHTKGPYLHGGRDPDEFRSGRYPWGWSNPPPRVWEAFHRSREQGYCGNWESLSILRRNPDSSVLQQDREIVANFVAHHSGFDIPIGVQRYYEWSERRRRDFP